MTDDQATQLGKRYGCATCGATFITTHPGRLPSCCGEPLAPPAGT